jgi:hypothetical protein
VLLDFHFHAPAIAGCPEQGLGGHPGHIPFGLQGEGPPADPGNPDSWLFREPEDHAVANPFQGESQDVKSTGKVGDGRRAKYAQFSWVHVTIQLVRAGALALFKSFLP